MSTLSDFSHVLIIANGSIERGAAFDRMLTLAQNGLSVICADGGANTALELGLEPAVIIGDMDSIFPATLQRFSSNGVEVIRKPPEKDETDLELAILAALERGAQWIRLVGATGNRLDQTVSNLQLLTLPQLRDTDIRLIDGRQTSWLALPGEYELSGEAGDTISLIPYVEDVTGITTQGLKYPLHDGTLVMGPARGVSNVINKPPAHLSFRTGRLLIVHTAGRA